jgi:hypothetical protein
MATLDETFDGYFEPEYTREQQEELHRFTTYLNYLKAISLFFNRDPDPPRLLEVVDSHAFRRLQGGRCPDPQRVRQLLRNAWCTEIQLGVAAKQEDLLGYSNHWAPVQLYYAVYLALRALFLAENRTIPNDHAATLNGIAEMIRVHPDLFPQPWKTLCIGDPNGPSMGYLNLPQGVFVDNISTLSNPGFTPFWDYYCLLIKTSRERQGIKPIEEWKRRNRRRNIPRAKRTEVMNNLPPTSFFYAVYRLRIRSNYADAESFLISLYNDADNREFHRTLRKVAWHTLKVIELLVARLIGKSQYNLWVEEFSGQDRSGLGVELVRRRWSSLRQLW